MIVFFIVDAECVFCEVRGQATEKFKVFNMTATDISPFSETSIVYTLQRNTEKRCVKCARFRFQIHKVLSKILTALKSGGNKRVKTRKVLSLADIFQRTGAKGSMSLRHGASAGCMQVPLDTRTLNKQSRQADKWRSSCLGEGLTAPNLKA